MNSNGKYTNMCLFRFIAQLRWVGMFLIRCEIEMVRGRQQLFLLLVCMYSTNMLRAHKTKRADTLAPPNNIVPQNARVRVGNAVRAASCVAVETFCWSQTGWVICHSIHIRSVQCTVVPSFVIELDFFLRFLRFLVSWINYRVYNVLVQSQTSDIDEW